MGAANAEVDTSGANSGTNPQGLYVTLDISANTYIGATIRYRLIAT